MAPQLLRNSYRQPLLMSDWSGWHVVARGAGLYRGGLAGSRPGRRTTKNLSRKPRIGLTLSRSTEGKLGRPWQGTAAYYPRGVHEAGGVPILLPIIPGSERDQMQGLDGLLLTGGADVDPGMYHAHHERGLGEVDPLRDAFEAELYAAAREANLPVLGICRGFQIINVLEGGTLHQHIPNVEGLWVDHVQPSGPGVLGHSVKLDSGSLVSRTYAGAVDLRVNSYHHQGVRDPAPSLVVSAWAPDGLVEALEGPNLLAVQWHPEMLFDGHPAHLAPFRGLVGMSAPVTQLT